MTKNISVITNFGCNANCWYCVWKGHPYEHIQLDTDWNKLEQFLVEYKHLGKVSVSGGGDCLYKYIQYEDWWNKFFELCNKYSMLVDIHSRVKFYNSDFWRRVNRAVVSVDHDWYWKDLSYLIYLLERTKLRVVHVVTQHTNLTTVADLSRLQKDYPEIQITLKQLVSYDDNGNYERIKKEWPQFFCLDSGDYNIYYFPDNSIQTNFMEPNRAI